jgi:hypothetical protein
MEIQDLELMLSNNSLYSSDSNRFNQLSTDLANSKKKLDDLLTEWIKL